MDYNEMKKLSKEALNDPKPGDYWQEMYSWHMYVLEVEETDKGKIITTISASAPCELPKDGKLQKRTHGEFKAWLSYGSIEGTWALCSKRNANIDWWKPQPPPASSTSSSNPLDQEIEVLKEECKKLKEEKDVLKERIQRILDDLAGLLIDHTELSNEKEPKDGI
jgi:hypothetical protein